MLTRRELLRGAVALVAAGAVPVPVQRHGTASGFRLIQTLPVTPCYATLRKEEWVLLDEVIVHAVRLRCPQLLTEQKGLG